MTGLRGPNDRIPLGRIALRLDPLTRAESGKVRDMLAQLEAEGQAPPARPRRRRLRVILGIVAALVALVLVLACGNGPGNDPGRPKCVDDKGRTTTCPEEWRAR